VADSPGVWIAECHDDVVWPRTDAVPTDASPVDVLVGTRVAVHASLASGGSVAGRISGPDSTALSDVWVSVVSTTGLRRETSTDEGGTYVVSGLPAGSYAVCFDAWSAQGPSPAGYLSECHADVPWDGYGEASGGTQVALATGARMVVDAQLSAAGGITGRVSDLEGTALAGVWVHARTGEQGSGPWVRTAADGTYRLTGLAEGSHVVCFEGGEATGGNSAHGHVAECYDDVRGSAADAVPRPVLVAPGTMTGGVDAAWPPAAASPERSEQRVEARSRTCG
jgi:hypothetical protein